MLWKTNIMDKFIEKLVETTLPNLPSKLSRFIMERGWEEKCEEICRRYGLDQQETYKVKIGLLLVLFGLQPLADFKLNVQKVLLVASLGEIIATIKEEVLGDIQTVITEYNEDQVLREKEVSQRYASLPPSLRQAAASINIENSIISIARFHELHVDQTGRLNDETLRVITGQTTAANFASQLQKVLEVEPDEAASIATEVSQVIFEPLRAVMKKESENSQEGEENLSAEQVLKEIENPRPTFNPENKGDLFEQKLSGSFNLPRVETATKDKAQGNQPNNLPPTAKDTDPYREPFN